MQTKPGVKASDLENVRFPSISLNQLGPSEHFSAQGLQEKSHKDPFIEWPSCEHVLQLSFKSENPIVSLSKLKLSKNDVEYQNMVFHQYKKGTESFFCRFPQPGIYNLTIFANKENPTAMPSVYGYLIKVGGTKPKHSYEFPKYYRDWKGCYLEEPLTGSISCNKTTKFRVSVPGAVKVAVLCQNERWTQLELGKGNVWVGDVNIGGDKANPDRTVQLLGNYSSESTSYKILVEFNIKI